MDDVRFARFPALVVVRVLGKGERLLKQFGLFRRISLAEFCKISCLSNPSTSFQGQHPTERKNQRTTVDFSALRESVLNRRPDIVTAEDPTRIEFRLELDGEPEADNDAARLFDEFGRGERRAAGGEQVVYDYDALARPNGVLMDFQHI